MNRSELAAIKPATVYAVTIANQQKISGRYVTEGTRTETGTVQVIRDGAALAVNDADTGKMLVLVAGALVESVVEVAK